MQNSTSRITTFIISSFLFLASILPIAAFAQIPQKISYQGYLTDLAGAPVDTTPGTIDIRFSIYPLLSGGSVLWTDTIAVIVMQGVYNVTLGPFGPTVLFDTEYFLEIEIDDGTGTGTFETLGPRQPLTAVPYALNAENISNNVVTTAKIVDSAVTQAKLADSSVTDAKITGTISAAKIQQGHGSGLDADTVDGQHAADIIASAVSYGGGVPAGALVLTESSTPPAGYAYTGNTMLPENDGWSLRHPIPNFNMWGFSVAVLNNKVYLFGGDSSDPAKCNANYVYDPSNDTWTINAPMPTCRSAPAVAVWNGKIYVIGGSVTINNVETYLDTHEAFDPSTNTWETKAPLPTPRSSHRAEAVNNKIYVFGGSTYDSVTYVTTYYDTNEEYDPLADTWSTKTPMPTARSTFASAAVNNVVYTIGGIEEGPGSVNSIVNEVYNPATNVWINKTNVPDWGSRHGAVINNSIYIYISGSVKKILEYDTIDNKWTFRAERDDCCAYGIAAVYDKIYLFGTMAGYSTLEYNSNVFYIHRKN